MGAPKGSARKGRKLSSRSASSLFLLPIEMSYLPVRPEGKVGEGVQSNSQREPEERAKSRQLSSQPASSRIASDHAVVTSDPTGRASRRTSEGRQRERELRFGALARGEKRREVSGAWSSAEIVEKQGATVRFIGEEKARIEAIVAGFTLDLRRSDSSGTVQRDSCRISGVCFSMRTSKLASGVSRTRIKEAQELAGTTGKSNDPIFDRQFLEKIESVRRSAYEQKKAEGERNFQPIDYDAPIESEQSKIGLATKIGVGVAVAVFGVVFAFGDSFPSGSNMPSGDNSVIEKKLSEKERSTLEETVRQFQETLSKSPKDSAALESCREQQLLW